MALIVQKYGGTSVGTPERIRNVASRILATQREGNSVVAVVSAMSGVTDNLLKLSKAVSDKPTDRELDVLLATGEQTTIALTAMAINAQGGRAISLTGAQAGILTDAFTRRRRLRTSLRARFASISTTASSASSPASRARRSRAASPRSVVADRTSPPSPSPPR